jgi:hypothetical protein
LKSDAKPALWGQRAGFVLVSEIAGSLSVGFGSCPTQSPAAPEGFSLAGGMQWVVINRTTWANGLI